MFSSDNFSKIVAVVVLLALSLFVPVAALSDIAPTAELSALPETGLTISDDGEAQYECGTVDVSQPIVSHVFQVKNATAAPLEIDRLTPTCGCTTAVLAGEKDAALPYRLDAGSVALIQVNVNVYQLHAGPFLKSLDVYLGGEEAPAIVLELSGTMMTPVDAMPSYIDFGHLSLGKSESRLLTISVSHKLLASTAFHLASTNPDIYITPVSDKATSSLTAPTSPSPWGSAQSSTEALTQKTYLITFGSLHKTGIIDGWLYVTPNDPHNDNSDYKMTTVRVTGEVDGKISPDSLTVAFGTATTGNDSLQHIEITCPSEDYRQHLRVTTTKFLQAHFEGADHHIDDGTGNRTMVRTDIVVLLKGTAPVGNFTGSVAISSPTGEALVLPVSAYMVQAPPAPDGQ